jgi:hypothetical protein
LNKALFYASKGLYVFPCREKYEGTYFSKRLNAKVNADPKMPRTPYGLKDATTDRQQIISWWSKKGWENSAIGVNCGASKLFVIDIDTHGKNGFDQYMKLGISDEGAYHSITANGGLHIIYSDPNGIGTTHTRELLGIDTRGVGGYIVMPPSFILDEQGNKKFYKLVEKDWTGFPIEISKSDLSKIHELFKINTERSDTNCKQYQVSGKDVPRVRRALSKLDFRYADDYQSWINVGMSLRELGNSGFLLWKEWTENKYFKVKPDSKRIGTLEYKWKSITEDKSNNRIRLGSLFFWAKETKNG